MEEFERNKREPSAVGSVKIWQNPGRMESSTYFCLGPVDWQRVTMSCYRNNLKAFHRLQKRRDSEQTERQ